MRGLSSLSLSQYEGNDGFATKLGDWECFAYHLVVEGETMLGLVSTHNRKKYGTDESAQNVSELPGFCAGACISRAGSQKEIDRSRP
jgi:hypothetical protein